MFSKTLGENVPQCPIASDATGWLALRRMYDLIPSSQFRDKTNSTFFSSFDQFTLREPLAAGTTQRSRPTRRVSAASALHKCLPIDKSYAIDQLQAGLIEHSLGPHIVTETHPPTVRPSWTSFQRWQ